MVHWLRARQPDGVGLQELKLTDDQLPADVFEAEGYSVVSHGQKAWNGVAILSRKPARVVQRGLPGQEDFGSRLISAELNGLSFISVYCPNGKTLEHDDYTRKLAWFDGLRQFIAESYQPNQPLILCGEWFHTEILARTVNE